MAVPEPSRAVFLSYASQDTPAAQRICDALRSGGVEVWFDKNELRGGDAWDRSIRQQIHDCALFMPIISGRSDARHEGYFRREWRLAVERAGDMSDRVAFLVPIVIDDTSESRADVPDRFRALQWTRLPGGETPPAFVERVQHLLSGDASKTIRAGSSVRGRLPASPRSKLPLAAVAMIALALLLVLGYLGLDRLRESRPGIQSESIAVLPLTNESGDAAEQYFSDGISEDLITALSQLPGLKVIGRASSFLFRDSKEDSRSIGAKLGVAHLLEGSVRRSGDVVRVSAELINTEDGSAQWSERYDRPYKDLFALQDEITRAVAGALKAKLLPAEHAAVQSDRPPSGSLEAYNAYLQGKFYYAHDTEVDYRKAIEFFTQATQLDPRYTRAWCGLSTTWTSVGAEFLDGAPAQEAYAKAREAASRALGLSPEFSDAHLAQGYLLLRADFNWRGAEAEYRRASELAPNDANAKFAFGNQLTTFGEMGQAVELTREALATEPLRADWYNWLAVYLSALNRLDEAEQAIRRAIELQPGAARYYEELTVIDVQRGNARAALAAALLEHPGIWQNIALALARSIGSDPRAADAALKTLIDKDAGDAPFQIAEVYALRNEADETFAWLDRAWRNRDPGVQSLLYDPFILRFKHDPRFAAFCHKVGLPVPGEAPASKST
ncbi:MAG: TIR domain-containing protein [Steroidobacteraceae bacterium]